ncbi:MAG: hypothetical protein HY288_03605, partial [Planctomycetia bacterium]|nr:hypothetical protein [Planctomycetia bacterium]
MSTEQRIARFDSVVKAPDSPLTRRELLCRSGMGLAALALAQLAEGDVLTASAGALNPLAPKQPHFRP